MALFLQLFVFHPPTKSTQISKSEMRNSQNEKINQKQRTNNNPKQPIDRVYIITRTKNHMASPRGSCNYFSQLKPKWVNKI
jgi:flagellar biosynthesis protein FliP